MNKKEKSKLLKRDHLELSSDLNKMISIYSELRLSLLSIYGHPFDEEELNGLDFYIEDFDNYLKEKYTLSFKIYKMFLEFDHNFPTPLTSTRWDLDYDQQKIISLRNRDIYKMKTKEIYIARKEHFKKLNEYLMTSNYEEVKKIINNSNFYTKNKEMVLNIIKNLEDIDRADIENDYELLDSYKQEDKSIIVQKIQLYIDDLYEEEHIYFSENIFKVKYILYKIKIKLLENKINCDEINEFDSFLDSVTDILNKLFIKSKSKKDLYKF